MLQQKYYYYKNKYISNKKKFGGAQNIENICENITQELNSKLGDQNDYNILLKILIDINKNKNYEINNLNDIITNPILIMNILYIIYIYPKKKEIQESEYYLNLINYIINPEIIKFDYYTYIPYNTLILYKILLEYKLYEQIIKYDINDYQMEIKIDYYEYLFKIKNFEPTDISKLIDYNLLSINNLVLFNLFSQKIIDIDNNIFVHLINDPTINIDNKNLIFLSKFLCLNNFTFLDENNISSLLDLTKLIINLEFNSILLKTLLKKNIHLNYLIGKGFIINHNIILKYIVNHNFNNLIEYINIHNIDLINDIIEDEIELPEKKFDINICSPENILYHGSFHKVNNFKLNTPCFYSMDILQSLGHLLIQSQSMSIYLQKKFRFKSEQLKMILSYYPLIYKYTSVQNIKLLRLDNTWDDDFKYIYRPNILYKYLIELENKIEIINTFCDNKYLFKHENIRNYKSYIQSFLILDSILSREVIDIIVNKIIYNILKYYTEICVERCFRGYIDTPGYYLLQSIRYNDYFNEIGIKEISDEIIGLYVPNDQDEIILFNNDQLNINDIIYVVPFSLEDKDDTIIKDYIKNYIIFATNLKNSLENSYEIFARHFIKLAGKINIDDTRLTVYNSWYFDHNGSYCKNFDAYTHEMTECPKDEKGNDLKIINYIDDNMYQYYMNNTQNQSEHKIKNSKISIYNLEDIDKLRIYIEFLNTRAVESVLQLFNNP